MPECGFDNLLGPYPGIGRLPFGELVERLDAPGNLQVMAALATEVAAIAANRHHLAVGSKVVDRLIADRPHLDCRNNAIRQVVKRAVTVHMRLAKTALAMA